MSCSLLKLCTLPPPSRGQVGRGSIAKYHSHFKKVADGPTDQQNNMASFRVASLRLKGVALKVQEQGFLPSSFKSHLLWKNAATKQTRPDTRLPQSRAGGQGLYLRSLDHLGRSSEAKDRKKKPKK